MTVGENIRQCRKERGISQRELAETIGVQPQTLSQWERDDRNPKIQTLARIAAALEVDVDDLIGGPQTFERMEFETGSRIKSAREKAGLTQSELGQLIGVSGVTIMRYEKEQRQASLKTLGAIAVTLGVDIGDLLGESLDYESDEKLNYRWINSDEQRPQIGSVGIDGFGNYPEVLTTVVELKTESGESLYFTERYLDEVRRSKGSKYELALCKGASIRWWIPLPPRPETNGIEADKDEQ